MSTASLPGSGSLVLDTRGRPVRGQRPDPGEALMAPVLNEDRFCPGHQASRVFDPPLGRELPAESFRKVMRKGGLLLFDASKLGDDGRRTGLRRGRL